MYCGAIMILPCPQNGHLPSKLHVFGSCNTLSSSYYDFKDKRGCRNVLVGQPLPFVYSHCIRERCSISVFYFQKYYVSLHSWLA